MQRWLRRIGFGVAIAMLIAVASLGVFALTLPDDDVSVIEPGLLVVTDDVTGRWKAGDLTVRLDTEQLTISEADRVVWQSPPGEAFVSAARGSVGMEEHRGYFWPSVDHERRWTEQRVDRAGTTDDGGVRLAGTLNDDGNDIAWHATVSPRPAGGALLEVGVRRADAVMLTSARTEGAGVHGFGEQFDDFDLDGRLLPILVREQGVGRGDQPLTVLADLTSTSAGGDPTMTYAAWASWVTDDLRGVALAADEPASHAFAVADIRDPGRVGLEVWSSTVTAELTSAETPAELVTARHVGSPRLPGWSQDGAIVGLQGGTLEVRRELGQLQAAGAEIAAVWLQDWPGQRATDFGERVWWTWQLDSQRYAGWEQLVADLDQQGIAVTSYVNPFLVDAEPLGDDIRNLYDEAREAGYLVTEEGGSPYLLDQGGFDAALVDLSSPEARDWYANVIAEEVLGIGVSGFMADFGEGLPFDAVIAHGNPRLAHNEWPRLWAQTVREACERAGEDECLTWFRSGSLGMGEDASLFWNGDQLVGFGKRDGLASALLGTFSAGVSGWPLVHSDIGGYTSVGSVLNDYTRSDELLDRWAELAAFGVVMRTHEGNRPDDNLQVFDPERVDAFARMTKVYAALEPYRAEVLAEATRVGLPAVRHGWLAAPGTEAAEVDSQFFLGDAILVAPVLGEGDDAVEVVFPPGDWQHLFTGRTYEEGTREVEAPVGRPAAFVRTDHPLAEQLVTDVRAAVQ